MQALQTDAPMKGPVTEVTMVLSSGGHVEHEWITHSSGSKSADIAALDKAAEWKFEGPECSHLRMTKLIAQAGQGESQ
jgi:outer membrane biosynthesis protein TonB